MSQTARSNDIPASARRALLGLYLDEVSEIVAQFVSDREFAAIHNTAATAVGDIDLKAKVFCRELAPHALRAVLRAREQRIRAKAIATNAATRRRSRSVHRPASARARRTPTRTKTPTGDPDSEPAAEPADCPGMAEVGR